jgi:predicted DNA-binding transcriptional regulator AlpA
MHPAKYRKLINAAETAEYLGISASTLSKPRVFGGGPKYLKLGRRVVYDTRDLDAWLDAHRRASTSEASGVVGMPEHPARACDAGSTAPVRKPPRRRGRDVALQAGR